jgi:hypothetical protein
MVPVWQEIDEQGHSCHSWRYVDGHSVSVMSLLLVLLLLVGAVLLAAAVVSAVRHDGYGSLEPPRSHPLDDAFPGWPGRLV